MRWFPWSSKIETAHEAAVAGAVTIPSGPSVELGAARVQGWQVRAWQLWTLLGEIHYPTSHLARQVGRLSWTVTIDDQLLPDEIGNSLLSAATFGPGLREASRLLALNFQVAADMRYIQAPDGRFDIYAVTTSGVDKLVEEAKRSGRLHFRLYNPDPIDPTKADSSVRTVIGPAEELLTLEALSRAQSRSRIAQAGMLLVPVEATFDDADPFGRDLETAMMAPIADENSPAAMVPIKVEMPEELIGKVEHLVFERPYDDRIHEKQERAIRRIALGLDIPPELLLGVDTVTHWTAWLVALETYTSHLEPLAAPIGELYADVIAALIERTDGRQVNVLVEPDPGELLAKRSTVRDAMDAAKLGAVGLAYVREAIGADPEDAPTDEELDILRLLPREPGREIMVDEQTGAPSDSGSPMAAAMNGDYDRGRLEGVLAMCCDGARSKIGSKIRTRLRGTPLEERIKDVANRDVVATLGLDDLDGFDLNAAVVDGLVSFTEWWTQAPQSDLPAATASLLVGTWIADQLAHPSAEAGPVPDWLVSDLSRGLSKEMTNA